MRESGGSLAKGCGAKVWSWDGVVFFGVWVSCLVFSFLRSPVPGVNEPHYLARAYAFVDPTWCGRDPFLQSAPVHWAFFGLMGWPVRWWGFEVAAIVGRVLGCGALSLGWSVLVWRLLPARWSPLWSLWLTLGGAAFGNFSGEWMVGGIEGKVFSYAALLGSMACLSLGAIPIGVFWGGVGVAFHPVIGVWHLLAALGSLVSLRLSRARGGRSEAKPVADGQNLADESIFGEGGPHSGPYQSGCHNQRGWRVLRYVSTHSTGLWWILGICCGLVGMIPAVMLLVNVDPDLARRGTEIQVYERLAHHLNPVVFPVRSYLAYAGLLVVALVTGVFAPSDRNWRFCQWYVGWCSLIALAGVVIGFLPVWFPESPWNGLVPRLLKFYPFRLADVLLPWLVVVQVLSLWTRWGSVRGEGVPQGGPRLLTVVTGGVWMGILLMVPPQDSSPALSPREKKEWIEVCEWVQRETPVDALCTTTRRGWAFKWYAQRAEYFSYKDAPQDGAGLVAWGERQRLLWELFSERFSQAGLERFRKETGCDYAVLGRATPCDLAPVFENESFAVYDLRRLGKAVEIRE